MSYAHTHDHIHVRMEVDCVDALGWKGQWRTWRGSHEARQGVVAEYTNVPLAHGSTRAGLLRPLDYSLTPRLW